ncbi:hypothetical protein MMC19_005778 [Ptychographa xylographoides]|nr:hypothetical protein [Ptychographa xylographoides]
MSPSPDQLLVPSQLHVLQKVVQNSLRTGRLSIEHMEDITNSVHPVRLLYLSDGSRLTLKVNPPATPLLKSERQDLDTEAQSLIILAKSGLPVPKVITHDGSGAVLGSPFLLTSRPPGTSLAGILPFLSRRDRMQIDRQLSDVETIMAQHLSPTFGPVAQVASGQGFKRWREAFKSMLGSVLKDGEDMFVNLPYAEIREQLARAESALDEVQESRLIVLDLGDPENVLVDERTKEVTGLIDFQKALWGDIDMVTGDAATSMRGILWVSRKPNVSTVTDHGLRRYTLYKAILVIVTCYYRTLREGKELDARRALTTALAQLAAANPYRVAAA